MNREKAIEAMARAIYEQRNGHGCYPWHKHTNEHKRPYRDDAAAAYDALVAAGLAAVPVEPTGEMIKHGHEMDPLGCDISGDDAATVYGRIYHAMTGKAE